MWQHETQPNPSITQRLRTDLGRLVGATTDTNSKLLWLNRFTTSQPSTYHKSYVIKQWREKGRDLTQSYDKSPYTSRNVKRAKYLQ